MVLKGYLGKDSFSKSILYCMKIFHRGIAIKSKELYRSKRLFLHFTVTLKVAISR